MANTLRRISVCTVFALSILIAGGAQTQTSASQIGREVAIPVHLQDGDEFNLPLAQLIDFGRQLFTAKFTVQEGAGRPMSKGTGAGISDPSSPLLFPRNFDRVSSPEATGSCGTAVSSGYSGTVAVSPNPAVAGGPYVCGDNILEVTSSNSNQGLKTSNDYCPACGNSTTFNGTNGHIDDYSSSQACSAHTVGDLGNFWTADTH